MVEQQAPARDEEEWEDLATIENPALINDEKENDLQIFQRLLRQGQDAAAAAKYSLADQIFLERLQMVDHCVALGSSPKIVHLAYWQYGEFLLQQAAQLIYQNSTDTEAYQNILRRARQSLSVAYNTLPEETENALLYGTVLLNQHELAEEILLKVLSTELKITKPETEFNLASFEDFSGYESDDLFPASPRFYAVLSSLFYLRGKPIECRKALILANRSWAEGGFGATPVSSHGKPRRTLVLLLSQTALFLYKYGLFNSANTCLFLAKDSESSCNQKAVARDLPSITPPFIKVQLKLAESASAWTASPKVSDVDAVDFASQAYAVADNAKDQVIPKLAEAKALNHLKSQPDELINAYLSAVREAMNGISLEIMIKEKIIPLDAFVTIGKYLAYSGCFIENINVLLYGCSIYNSAALCFLLGLSYLRIDRFDEAEAVLMEGNVLDNRHTDIWAYLCFICIMKGYHRLKEADHCLFQTLRLGQNDPGILRELGVSFMSVDKLQTAEDLIRRTIALETSNNPNNKPNATTRKLLADILAGQNMAAKAIDEYKLILIDDNIDSDTKLNIAEKCLNLLTSLGREEEIQSLRNIMEIIKSET